VNVKLAFSVREAAQATGLSASTIDRAIRAGKLRIRRTTEKDGEVSGSRLILAADLDAYLAALPEG
jgi:excisionase family DNA binding protein